jgi:hypothetical protein
MAGSAGVAKAAHSEIASKDGTSTYLVSELPTSNPVQEARLSNKAEVALLKEVRENKHPAFILNGALEFHGKTTIYLGPTAKGHRVFYDTNSAGGEVVGYYPMIVPYGGTLWAAVFDNHHSQANVGQGSNYGSVGWIPLNEAKYTVYQNAGDESPGLLKFHEVYDASPEGPGVPPTPVYNIEVNGTNTQLPRNDAIMDTEMWTQDAAKSNLEAAGLVPLSTQAANLLFAGVGKY